MDASLNLEGGTHFFVKHTMLNFAGADIIIKREKVYRYYLLSTVSTSICKILAVFWKIGLFYQRR